MGYIGKELGRTISRSPLTAIVSLLSLALLLLLFDLFWVTARTSHKAYDSLITTLKMEIYLSEEVPDSTIDQMHQSLVDMQAVRLVEYFSKDRARMELTELAGVDLLVGYDTLNPLPRSFLLSLEPDHVTSNALTGLEEQLRMTAQYTEIIYDNEWLKEAESSKSYILKVGLVLGSLILLTALFNTANSIRLMARARATGIHQMLLLGASRTFVSLPFILEGLLLSGLSAILSWLAVLYAKKHVSLPQIEIILPSFQEIALFCLAVALLGAVSGFLGVRKLLRY
ncbi:MAG: permease-like cell division protein FtsX [candidate division Zixibacteria bacterium]|nr:permease-like cell division protein FtsX [candidate division Zixibacteria bacterium]